MKYFVDVAESIIKIAFPCIYDRCEDTVNCKLSTSSAFDKDTDVVVRVLNTSPETPVAPVGPVGPVGPVPPVTPVTPVGPVAPVGPV